jgi:hypothetical protein
MIREVREASRMRDVLPRLQMASSGLHDFNDLRNYLENQVSVADFNCNFFKFASNCSLLRSAWFKTSALTSSSFFLKCLSVILILFVVA